MRNAGANRCLPRRGLAKPCRQHAAHIDVVDLLSGYADALQRFGYRDAAQRRRRYVAEGSAKASHRSPYGADDDPLLCVHISPGLLTSCTLLNWSPPTMGLQLRFRWDPPKAATPCRTSFAPDARPYLPGTVLPYTSGG